MKTHSASNVSFFSIFLSVWCVLQFDSRPWCLLKALKNIERGKRDDRERCNNRAEKKNNNPKENEDFSPFLLKSSFDINCFCCFVSLHSSSSSSYFFHKKSYIEKSYANGKQSQLQRKSMAPCTKYI